MTQVSRNKVVTLVDATVETGMALVSFVQRYVKTIKCWFPDLVFGKRSRMYIARNGGRTAAGS